MTDLAKYQLSNQEIFKKIASLVAAALGVAGSKFPVFLMPATYYINSYVLLDLYFAIRLTRFPPLRFRNLSSESSNTYHSPAKLPSSVSPENHPIPTLILRSGIVHFVSGVLRKRDMVLHHLFVLSFFAAINMYDYPAEYKREFMLSVIRFEYSTIFYGGGPLLLHYMSRLPDSASSQRFIKHSRDIILRSHKIGPKL
jgi:hypothetical protein